MDRNCFNCVFCSEHYPSLKDSCDIDEHIIKDAEKERCNEFVSNEENSEMEDEYMRSGY